ILPTSQGGGVFNRDHMTRGFRPGKVPHKLVIRRRFGGTALVKSSVERADAAWIHGRDQDARLPRLRDATVAILGCGSVGAPVALQLASAGVGRLLLVDPDRLRWANVGRHPLGASDIDKHKSSALAERILSSYPHALGVDSLTCRWQDAGPESLRR